VIICTELGRRGHELLTLLAAHASKRMDGSTGVEPADQSYLWTDLPVRWQPRDSPISSNSTGYGPSTSAPAFENFRNSAGDTPPSGSGSCRRGTEAAGYSCCNGQACSAFFEDSHTHTRTHTPPISYPTTCSYVKKIRPLTNHADFVSGRFLAEKTYLVGY
jgi:hypothetical protein